MAQAKITTPQGTLITFIAETFTGDVSTASTLAVAATDRMRIKAFSLTVTGNTAVCPLQLKGSSTGVYYADRIPAILAAGVGAQVRGHAQWQGVPWLATLVAGEELVIGGGATAGVLDGFVLVDIVPA